MVVKPPTLTLGRMPTVGGGVRGVGNLTGWSVRAALQDGKASMVGVGLAGLPEPELATRERVRPGHT
jgi:hypothetical protein